MGPYPSLLSQWLIDFGRGRIAVFFCAPPAVSIQLQWRVQTHSHTHGFMVNKSKEEKGTDLCCAQRGMPRDHLGVSQSLLLLTSLSPIAPPQEPHPSRSAFGNIQEGQDRNGELHHCQREWTAEREAVLVMRSGVPTKEKSVLPGKYIDSIFVPNNIFSV